MNVTNPRSKVLIGGSLGIGPCAIEPSILIRRQTTELNHTHKRPGRPTRKEGDYYSLATSFASRGGSWKEFCRLHHPERRPACERARVAGVFGVTYRPRKGSVTSGGDASPCSGVGGSNTRPSIATANTEAADRGGPYGLVTGGTDASVQVVPANTALQEAGALKHPAAEVDPHANRGPDPDEVGAPSLEVGGRFSGCDASSEVRLESRVSCRALTVLEDIASTLRELVKVGHEVREVLSRGPSTGFGVRAGPATEVAKRREESENADPNRGRISAPGVRAPGFQGGGSPGCQNHQAF